jgi:hypothetical protein
MQLIFDSPPRVGENFRLAIYSSAAPARVEWYVDGRLVRRTDCPDPPCHEQMFMRPEHKDSTLRIVGTDRSETKELRFQIKEEDPTPTVATA